MPDQPIAKRLIIMRHADTANGSPSGKDFDRPLTDTGIRNAAISGRYIQQQYGQPEIILSSPAIRARQTSEIVAEALSLEETQIHYIAELYLASAETLSKHCQAPLQQYNSILLIAHNPGLESLAHQLLHDDEQPMYLSPACFVMFGNIDTDFNTNGPSELFNPRQ